VTENRLEKYYLVKIISGKTFENKTSFKGHHHTGFLYNFQTEKFFKGHRHGF
jgi:hypothetical protein